MIRSYTIGTWSFQKDNGQLLLTDSTNKRLFTVFNLDGSHVELLKGGYDRYMRKQ